jgi:HD-GYP domain-containing protein (c-di-GMP phosphodiesterase class II)
MEQVRVGMKLAVTVSHPEQPDHSLLNAGFELNDDVISRLRDLGVENVYVDYPDLADLDKHMAAYLSPERQVIYNQIRDAMTAVQKQAKPNVPYNDYYNSTRELIMTLMRQGEHAIYLDQMSGKLGAHAVAHATAVAHLSLMLGLRLETYLVQQRQRLSAAHAREVINLGVAAMLHDIGVAQLPPALRKCSRVAPPEDAALLAEWQTHPHRGYDLIKPGVEATAASAVLHHHQHFDGTGFPLLPVKPGDEPRNAGERIHIFARILAVADLYDRLTVGETGHRRPNIEILHLMRTRYASTIDPMIMKVVPGVVPPFPPGMTVTLNDSTDAVVVGLQPQRPYQPLVKRIADLATFKLGGPIIDMSLQSGLRIERVGCKTVSDMIPDPVVPTRAVDAA